eukprot:5802890-Prymnesium_polylepis.2
MPNAWQPSPAICHQHTVAAGWQGAYLELTNVSLWPCRWRALRAPRRDDWAEAHNFVLAATDEGCSEALVASHPDADVAEAIQAAIGSCGQASTAARGQSEVWFRPMAHDGVRAEARPHAPASAQHDVALLIDAWGTASLYHSVVDTLFTAMTTLAQHARRADACVGGGATCGVFLVHRHHWRPLTAYAAAVARLLFGGDGVVDASELAAARYPTVLVGSLVHAYEPLKYPRVRLGQVRFRAPMHSAWRAFIGLIHSQLTRHGLAPPTGAAAPAAAFGGGGGGGGVWIWRSANDSRVVDTTGEALRRSLMPAEVARLEAATAPWLRVARLHELTFVQQARLMSSTTLLAGLEGAGFVNQLLMPRAPPPPPPPRGGVCPARVPSQPLVPRVPPAAAQAVAPARSKPAVGATCAARCRPTA